MHFAGVDPGLKGAMALLDRAGHVIELHSTPTRLTANDRSEYDIAAIAVMLRGWADLDPEGLLVTVEKLRALPATRIDKDGHEVQLGGFQTNLHRGEARGFAWMIAGLAAKGANVQCAMVEPMEWHRELAKGWPACGTKDRSIALAKALWPGVNLARTPRARLDSPDLAESLLLAELGRRRYLGGELFAANARP
jgi:hypothetical protein